MNDSSSTQPAGMLSAAQIRSLAEIHGIGEDTVARISAEILEFRSETFEEFVVRRHSELQKTGRTNGEIYPLLREELSRNLFRAPGLSERQIRRIVYG